MATHAVAEFAQNKWFTSFIFLLRILQNFGYIISYKNFAFPTGKDLFC